MRTELHYARAHFGKTSLAPSLVKHCNHMGLNKYMGGWKGLVQGGRELKEQTSTFCVFVVYGSK